MPMSYYEAAHGIKDDEGEKIDEFGRKHILEMLFDNVVYMNLDLTHFWKHYEDFSAGNNGNLHLVFIGIKKRGTYKGKQCLILCHVAGEYVNYKPIEGNYDWRTH